MFALYCYIHEGQLILNYYHVDDLINHPHRNTKLHVHFSFVVKGHRFVARVGEY